METTNVEVVDNKALETRIDLKRPIVFEDETISQINLDFESLTGEDIEKAEAQFNAENPQNSMIMVKEMSKPFLAIVASKAAKVNVALIRKLSAPDYAKVTTRCSLFLLGGK
ncbi:phage tail assembly protein [Lysinibacillus sp. FSL P4-0201]|uniref:phage tail assembly protein n=1 Tax=Lysinibacillus sp. FSL P4-0201 TaxID=2921721 RepID=UPI00315A93DB